MKVEYYAYVLQSLNDPNYFYKGHCVDLNIRLKEHNSGSTRSNKHKAPFKIAHYEVCGSRDEAIKKEKYWKTAAGRRYLQKAMAS